MAIYGPKVADWGTVPDWIAAVGTSGSLLLGFSLLYRDRLHSDRRDAENVLCYLDWVEGRLSLQVHNTSTRLVQETTFYYVDSSDDESPPLESLHRQRLPLLPGARTSFEVATDAAPRLPLFVTFRDTDGRYWLRQLGDRSDLLRLGRSQRRHDRQVSAELARSFVVLERERLEGMQGRSGSA